MTENPRPQLLSARQSRETLRHPGSREFPGVLPAVSFGSSSRISLMLMRYLKLSICLSIASTKEIRSEMTLAAVATAREESLVARLCVCVAIGCHSSTAPLPVDDPASASRLPDCVSGVFARSRSFKIRSSFARFPVHAKCIGSGCLRPKLQAVSPYKTRPSANSGLLPLLLGFASPHTIRPPPG